MWSVPEISEALRKAARGIIKCRIHSKALQIQQMDGSVQSYKYDMYDKLPARWRCIISRLCNQGSCRCRYLNS